ncbi:MAG: hypothetical protein HG454_002315 [Clostridiales bacterium]|nr:hypothetical protein [Clostridiales bacterium]
MSKKFNHKLHGISNITEINAKDRHTISKKAVDLIYPVVSEFNISKEMLFNSLGKSNMYLADFDDLSMGKYDYTTNSIYFSNDLDISKLDSSVIHEILHFFQAELTEDNFLIRMGLFKPSKLFRPEKGLGLNEASVQYIASTIVKEVPDHVKYYELELTTPSSNYYPIETAIIRQMCFFTGTYPLFFSTLFSTDLFEKTFKTITSEENYNYIEEKLTYIVQLQEKLSDVYSTIHTHNQAESKKISVLNNITNLKNKLRETVLDVQKIIYTSAFANELDKIETVQDIVNMKTLISNFENYIINYEGDYSFEQFKDKINIELNNKLALIEAYGNYSFALKAKKDILNLPKIYSQSFIKTFFSKIKLLIDLRFNFSRSNDEELYENEI